MSTTLLIVGAVSVHLWHPNFAGILLTTPQKSDLSIQAEMGKKIYYKHKCNDCHGSGGANPALNSYPKLNGQNRDYLLDQMLDIKLGDRKNGASSVMRSVLKNISDEELLLISIYLSEQK